MPTSRSTITNSNPPGRSAERQGLKGTSCTATRTATTELRRNTEATNAAVLAASRCGSRHQGFTVDVWLQRSVVAKFSGVWMTCRLRAKPSPLEPPTPGAAISEVVIHRTTPQGSTAAAVDNACSTQSWAARFRWRAQPPLPLLTFPGTGHG